MSDNSIVINVRYSSSGAYIARAKEMNNKTASCTVSAEGAMDALAKKLFGDKTYKKTRYGNSNTWVVEATVEMLSCNVG